MKSHSSFFSLINFLLISILMIQRPLNFSLRNPKTEVGDLIMSFRQFLPACGNAHNAPLQSRVPQV